MGIRTRRTTSSINGVGTAGSFFRLGVLQHCEQASFERAAPRIASLVGFDKAPCHWPAEHE
jgi:hypothetical protein